MPDDISPSDAPVSSGGGITDWVRTHKGLAIGGGSVALLTLYVLYRRHRATPATQASGTGAVPGTTTGGEIYEIAPGYLGSDMAYGSSLGYTSGIQSNTGSPVTAGQGVTGVSSTSGSATSGSVNDNASHVGYGVVNTVLGQMIDLGVEYGTGPQAYHGYDVAGGEPVYYGNTEQLAEGTKYAVAGSNVYTPVASAPFVTATPDR